MAAVQHTRTRSARLIANLTNKSAPQHGVGPAQPTSHGASAVSLFLTNLKLLDLDLRPDWPGISAETFAITGTSAQGQKKRVQCVEWALYHLFALWDADETRNVRSTTPGLILGNQNANLTTAIETKAVFPSSRSSPVSEPPRGPPPSPRTGQEERSSGERCDSPEDHVGRV